MKWKKRAMSLVLTGCLAAGMLVPAAMAVDTPDITEQIVEVIGEKQAAYNPAYVQTKATYTVDGDKDGFVYNYVYNKNDRIVKSTAQYFYIDNKGAEVRDSKYDITTLYTYDSKGNLIKQENQWETCDYQYNAAGKVTTATYTDKQDSENSYKAAYSYDSKGILTKVVQTYTIEKTKVQIVTTFAYDSKGNVKSATSTWDGEFISKVEYTYDSNNNVISMKETDYDMDTVTTYYTYDAQGNLTKETCEGDTIDYDYQLASEWKAAHPATVDEIFRDVKTGSWYCDFVQAAYDMDLMSGSSDTTFSPNGELSRAMLVQILYNAEGKPQVTGKSSFSDVKAGTWYYNAVVWAEQNNVSAGVGGGKFGTNEVVSRDQLATMLHNYAGKPEADAAVLAKYPDANKVSGWAVNGMSWAVSNEIITGSKQADGSIHLDPKSNATRAQAATILSKYFSEKK
ncbi:MAG: S-layer homology domain-containing protein [Clostridia bacterium]|nr:S-layer homology domain-containing protein [Clostridia bacterium]